MLKKVAIAGIGRKLYVVAGDSFERYFDNRLTQHTSWHVSTRMWRKFRKDAWIKRYHNLIASELKLATWSDICEGAQNNA